MINTLQTFVRVAALFTYKQLLGAKAQDFLVKLAQDAEMREFALKALADRKSENGSLPIALFVNNLRNANPRVRLQAIIGLARIGKKVVWKDGEHLDADDA